MSVVMSITVAVPVIAENSITESENLYFLSSDVSDGVLDYGKQFFSGLSVNDLLNADFTY